MAKRGPKPTTVSDIVRAIEESDKRVMTVGEIAEQLNVSSETVRRRRDEFESRDRVQMEQVGRATAYYIDPKQESEPEPVTGPVPGSGGIGRTQEEPETDESGSKGWLDRLSFT